MKESRESIKIARKREKAMASSRRRGEDMRSEGELVFIVVVVVHGNGLRWKGLRTLESRTSRVEEGNGTIAIASQSDRDTTYTGEIRRYEQKAKAVVAELLMFSILFHELEYASLLNYADRVILEFRLCGTEMVKEVGFCRPLHTPQAY
ncbi:hypothetical protein Sjap_006233 [Stephania japonica]|uniref:Uncharacterized protein n=1 Tax=Stephania japonica TaxID=461633 RepID=A0AAP0K6N0_9MAGN